MRGFAVAPLLFGWLADGIGVTVAAGTVVLLIVIELVRDCHVAFGFARTTFGELFFASLSLSGVGEFTLGLGIVRPNVLYCGPVVDEGIGLSVMLLLRFVFDGCVGTLKGRLFTGVTVSDEFTILRGKLGDGALLGVELEFDFDICGCCGALGEARR